MKQVSLSGSPRENVGKKDAEVLREKGMVPCVAYGGKEQVHFYIDERHLNKLIFTPEVYQVNLNVDGKEIPAIIQDVQFHPVTDKPLHVDFLEIHDDKPVKVKLPVRLNGQSQGVLMGGKLALNFKRLKVTGLPNAFPDRVEVDISGLKIGDSVRVRDLEHEGVRFLDPADAVVVAVKTARGAQAGGGEEEGEEAAAEGGEAPAEGGE